MAQLEEHMATDDLVGWGWHPGGNRTPVPGTQTQFGDLFKALGRKRRPLPRLKAAERFSASGLDTEFLFVEKVSHMAAAVGCFFERNGAGIWFER